MQPVVRTAFVMEQALGHVTHARNLQSLVAERPDVASTWLPIPFDVRGAAKLVPLLRSNWSVRASWRARRALGAALARESHDALVFHTQVTALFSVSLMRRLPSIVSLDATPINYDQVGQFYGHRAAGNGLLDRRKFQMNQAAFNAAAALVTWSNWARASLIHDYAADPSRIHVLAPGAAPAYFSIGERRVGEHRDAATRTTDRVKVLFVGGDFQRKGGPLLLDSMRNDDLLSQRCELHLVTGASIDPQPNVYVHRDLTANSPELLDMFSQADVFVLPSYAECLAVVLMEATAAGLPIITTEVGALGEAVEPGQSGLTIRPGDGAGLRQALETLVVDPARRRQMGRAGHTLAHRKFNAHRNNHALLDLVVEHASTSLLKTTRRAA
jgi:glycosyltransferase involved in cell wall biosynthesis